MFSVSDLHIDTQLGARFCFVYDGIVAVIKYDWVDNTGLMHRSMLLVNWWLSGKFASFGEKHESVKSRQLKVRDWYRPDNSWNPSSRKTIDPFILELVDVLARICGNQVVYSVQVNQRNHSRIAV